MLDKHVVEDIMFLLSFAPTEVRVPDGYDPTMYRTGTHEGDQELADRVQEIKKRYDIVRKLKAKAAKEFPHVLGEDESGIILIQTAKKRGRMMEPSYHLYPEGSIQPILARFPFDNFDGNDTRRRQILDDYQELVEDGDDA